MLDGRYKPVQDRFWDRVARRTVPSFVTPNQITVLGTLLMAAACAAYAWHRSAWIFGAGVALIEMTDNLDGAVARIRGRTTRFGAYLDAVTDRYKETLIYLALAWVTGLWLAAFLCVTGSLLTSYGKARAGMEMRIDNAAWPDVFERFERLFVLCTGLILSAFVPPRGLFGYDLIPVTLWAIALLTHVSALQRILRARKLLLDAERDA